jgi:GT2 family glycosyltransferase
VKRETCALVVLWHDHPELWRGYAELAACGGWDEFVVIDNGSTPEVAEFLVGALLPFGPAARVFRPARNEYATAMNLAVASLKSEMFVLMPNDFTLTDRRWFEWTIEGARPGVMQGPMAAAQYQVPYLDAIMCLWKRDYERIGGRDPAYEQSVYWEDVDFCWRAQMLGIALRLTRCGVHHIGGATTGGTPDDESRRRWVANRDMFLARMAKANKD